LLAASDVFQNDPPEPGEQPVSVAAVYLCECGNVINELRRPVETADVAELYRQNRIAG
jgi:hypothetical protein